MNNCPSCNRPAMRRAFGPSPLYVTCALGHVFAAARTVSRMARH